MKTAVKYVSIAIGSTLVLGISALFIPPITKAIVEKSLSHFLEVNASVEEAILSIHGLSANGHLNQTDSFLLKATTHSFLKATVRLHYIGDVHTFSKVATVELPYIKTTLDANFTTDNLLLKLKADLLEGHLSGSVDLQKWKYDYNISHVDLTSFRTQQKQAIDNYASGQLSASGEGIIEAPYSVDFLLKSQNLKLEQNTTSLISPELNETLPLTLKIQGIVSAEDLNTTLFVDSSLLDLNVSTLYYDFNQSDFNLVTSVKNYNQKVVPIKKASLDLNGSLKNDQLEMAYLLSVDDYHVRTEKLTYDLNASVLDLDYHLSSLKQKPLNLQKEFALFGKVDYKDEALIVYLNSKALNSPILLTLKENQLHLISSNISLEALQVMGNQEIIAKGTLAITADANLSASPLRWESTLKSDNLELPQSYKESVGIKNSIAFDVDIYNRKDGDIYLVPSMQSNIATLHYSAFRYIPKKDLIFFNINLNKVKTPLYRAPSVNLRGSLNLAKSRLNKTTWTSKYEQFSVNELYYGNDTIQSHMALHLTHMERFATLDPEYELDAKVYLRHTDEKSEVLVSTQRLGAVRIDVKDKVIKIKGRGLALEEAMKLSDQPILMEGKLDYDLRYSSSSIKASVNSKQLRGHGEMNSSVRPFALDFTSALKYNKDRYRGKATLKTDNETFKISNISVDLSKNQLRSHYKLDINALEKNTFILPKEFKGPLHVYGDYKQDKYQHITLKLVDFELSEKWHKMLDANATSSLKTNASIQVYNDKGLINLNAKINNRLLELRLKESDYNLKNGDFHIKTHLQTDLWLKDTDLTAQGHYDASKLKVSDAQIKTAHLNATLDALEYTFEDQNLSTDYRLNIFTYNGAPYYSDASIYGQLQTKPKLYITAKSDSLGGDFNAHVTDTTLYLKAKKVSVPKLIAFSGQKVPISNGTLNAYVNITSPTLLDGNLSTLKGQSDLNISDMTLEGLEIDDLLKTLKDSQDLNLFQGNFSDLPIVRSVKNIPSNITTASKNETHFGEIRLYTDINETGLHCKDCAVATQENLMAIKGSINLEQQTFDQFYVGMLFPNNCAYFIQQVEGNLSEPQVELAAAGFHVVGGAAKSLIGNVGTVLDFGADVIKDTGSAVGGAASYVPVVGEKTDKALTRITNAPKDISNTQTCIPFYTGFIKHPHVNKEDKN